MVVAATLLTELSALEQEMVTQLRAFPAASFSIAPAPQSWSAAELAEHLLIVIRNINGVVKAEGSAPDRPADKKLPVMKAALADRTTKRIAPENVKPMGTLQGQDELINALQEQLAVMKKTVEQKELTELCTVYPHPSLGRLTRLEWVHFIIHHTRRHLLQLEQIRETVTI